jgi:hypothetical protein
MLVVSHLRSAGHFSFRRAIPVLKALKVHRETPDRRAIQAHPVRRVQMVLRVHRGLQVS